MIYGFSSLLLIQPENNHSSLFEIVVAYEILDET